MTPYMHAVEAEVEKGEMLTEEQVQTSVRKSGWAVVESYTRAERARDSLRSHGHDPEAVTVYAVLGHLMAAITADDRHDLIESLYLPLGLYTARAEAIAARIRGEELAAWRRSDALSGDVATVQVAERMDRLRGGAPRPEGA